ncbi:class I SAM-dependent DNA methyltransferase [Nocardiopsis exhalans]|uniref:site-specific DNA-methyltransferase (adenine-specific) n=1 Tax=Nocardiopsis exhalans TaxID=163604 RepID=A0ABY5DFG9_9ACTN|nr:class I SAM-dependent DNA methyltransferase [Nocardiopsis exhalans]USY22506.1 class I SAM-dependent DNA methyltransferase [Nocardiopsis exhalans]
MSYDSVINRGEYFSDHYLAEFLPKALKQGVFKDWAERESAEAQRAKLAKENEHATDEERRRKPVTPREKLRRLRSRYFEDRPALAEYTERFREDPDSLTENRVADHVERLHGLHREVLTALGYTPKDEPYTAHFEHGGSGSDSIEVRLALHEPTLAAIECGWAPDLDAAMDPDGAGWLLAPIRWGNGERDRIDLGTKLVSWLFAREEGLRYVLVLVGGVVILADRTVWGEGRYLAVSLDAALSSNATDELGTIAALLGAEALLPSEDGSGDALSELVEKSHHHSVAVSKELRQGLQSSVEIIANEVLARLREEGVNPRDIDTGTGRSFAEELARQSLRYLYRILFLLYAEARPELGVVPAKDESYLRGYSMARLGDLVVHELQGEEARGSTHLYESLNLLFRMVNEGHNQRGYQLSEEEAATLSEGEGLRFEPLKADLFDPARTNLIGTGLVHPEDDPDEPEMDRLDTRLRNGALHRVLRLLMLSRGSAKGRGGFISYAQLGINQLGAVYEGLMSYTGRIAEETLYEAAKNGDPKDGSWLVPHSKVDDYPDNVWVHVKDDYGKPTVERVVYKPGQFVYRLAGRDRETSASYYTPESLTRLTVQLTLRERLDQDGEVTPARELLEWTICEPALGSGAFLNEAINQVAAEYLKRAQDERGEQLDPEKYTEELQKVKAYIALHRAYGVDLNETAVELAEVSLWLNVMYPGLQAPWFGLHLKRGNSLVGAGRRLYSPDAVKKGDWLKSAPKDVPFRDGEIPEGYIHHWLLPAQGWGSVAGEKEAKSLAPDETAKLNAWRKSMRKRPKATGKKSQFKRLQGLSRRAEYLWGWVIRRLELSEKEISREIDVYGADWIEQPENPLSRDEVKARLERKGSPYWRLKTVMDAWCALWFWPVQQAGLLDGSDEIYGRLERSLELSSAGGETLFDTAHRSSKSLVDLDEWLDFAEAVLGSHDIPDDSLYEGQIRSLGELDYAEEMLPGFMGMIEPYKMGEIFPWLSASVNLSKQYGFFHWELHFAHIFNEDGGFDIQVGNPPWVRPHWREGSVLAELDPFFALDESDFPELFFGRKDALLGRADALGFYLSELTRVAGMSDFLSSPSVYPFLGGTKPDLYRAFMCRSWSSVGVRGAVGLIHPDTHFEGSAERFLRENAFRRLRIHGHFINKLEVFADIDRNAQFGVHVYGAYGRVQFKHLSWLFLATTLIDSLDHDGGGDVPGIKNLGAWDVRPHRARVVVVDGDVLEGWWKVSGSSALPVAQTPLLYPVTVEESGAVEALSDYRFRVVDEDPYITIGFDEAKSKKEGLIKWLTSKPGSLESVILQGPHVSQATPFYKQPNIPCKTNRDWSLLGLSDLGEEVVPVSNYIPSGSPERYYDSHDSWGEGKYVEYFRIAWRSMVPPSNERSLFAALIPPGPAHVHAMQSMAFRDLRRTVLNSGFWASLPLDYLLRIAGRSHLQTGEARKMPAPSPGHPLEVALLVRTMRLNSLTNAYAPLWSELYEDSWLQESWAVGWEGLAPLQDVTPEWEYVSPLRTERERRAALVELDALVSVWLGITADQLAVVYRSRFPVLADYEAQTWFDANGRKVAKNHNTYGYGQTKENYLQLQKYLKTEDPAEIPSGYSAPFYKADREAEYREAHAYFTEIVERAKRDGTWNGEV